MQELKAQRDDAFRKVVGLKQYFIILCTDTTAHKKKIRNVSAEFRSAFNTEVIEPSFFHSFLNHSQSRIDAIVTHTMEAHDVVLKKAIDSIELPSPSARALAIYLAVQFTVSRLTTIDYQSIITEPTLCALYDKLREDQEEQLIKAAAISQQGKRKTRNGRQLTLIGDTEPSVIQIRRSHSILNITNHKAATAEEQIAMDLDLLDSDLIDLDSASGVIRPTDELTPLSALILDAVVRYDYTEKNIMPYMFNLFGVTD